jgi:hypothetical protein
LDHGLKAVRVVVNKSEYSSEAAREYPADNSEQQDIGAAISATTICGQSLGLIKHFIVTFSVTLKGPPRSGRWLPR